ncbi:hypothetical protein PFWH6_1091 [Pseudomonas fluorescens WH6]|nr:hypothetical protein PFWH6_1091 [Pseudomonas fluorescens WH6]
MNVKNDGFFRNSISDCQNFPTQAVHRPEEKNSCEA